MTRYLIYFLITTIIGMGVVLKNTFDHLDFLDTKFQIQKKTANNLHKKNKTLISQKRQIRHRISQEKKNIVQKHINRTKNKIASAPAKMVPFVGAGLVIAMTAYDIQESCEDIQEFKKFEQDICGLSSHSMEKNTNDICGLSFDDLKKLISIEYKNSTSVK
ncbi:MAG: hypothetical protein ISR68_01985 [Campylobacterales bacterium]|nr:hypothetical protein [Campylobacterales bacterium]